MAEPASKLGWASLLSRRSSVVRSSTVPLQKRWSAWQKTLLVCRDASANKVIEERNFMSSGEPKIALSERPSIASTRCVHVMSRGPSSG
jgi:hypothetical protein